ncbi:MAG: DNA-processing protein DprA [Patescibacteria group bacterium]
MFASALAHFPKITYTRYRKLTAYFSDLKKAWEAEIADLAKAGLEEDIANEFLLWRDNFSLSEMEEKMDAEGIFGISIQNKNYPRLLKEIADPPFVLFVRGKLPSEDMPSVAVVGTRACSNYGRQTAFDIAGELAGQGAAIISGLALGIDGIAHEAALQNQGITVAVLGSGVDREHVYPSFHKNLSEKIIEQGGALVSEYPPGFEPTRYSFPARNRIIAGLSLGTLVVEAPEESGALITAKCALDYNREIFAIPHQIRSRGGIGPNNLIKMGARLVTEASDIVDALNLYNLKQITDNRKILPSTPEEEKILSLLTREPIHIDALAKASGLDSSKINSTLALMEMKGKLKNMGGMMYCSIR